MADFAASFVTVFLTFFALMDPFAGIPFFLSLTRKFSAKERVHAARDAILVASIPFLIFLFVGQPLLDALGITLSSFKVAGGIVLLILGLQLVLNFSVSRDDDADASSASVIIGIPLITGPGVIAVTIVFVAQYGFLTPLLAGLLALFLSYLVLRASQLVLRLLGEKGVQILSRLMGLLLAALAVEFIRTGLAAV